MADYYVDENGKVTKKKKKNQTSYTVDSKGRVSVVKQEEDDEDDIAPIRVDLSPKNPVTDKYSLDRFSNALTVLEKEKAAKQGKDDFLGLDFLQKGAFSDGYQFGDVTKAILGTAGDAVTGIVKGAMKTGEGVGDLVSYGIAGAADLLGHDEYAHDVKVRASESSIDNLFKGADRFLDQYSVLGRTSSSVMEGVGQVGTMIATGGLGQAAGFGSAGVTALTTGLTGVSGTGSAMGEAYKGGATDQEAVTYGLISGTADAITEMIFGGLGKTVNAIGISKGLSSADDMLAKTVSNRIKNTIAKNAVQFGIKASGEGVEELLAGLVQGVGKWATYMKEDDIWSILQDENLLEQFVVGAFTSGITQASSLHQANQSGRDFISGMNANEEAVVSKEAENRIAEEEKKTGEKMSAKEKNAVYEAVQRDMDKGYISIDTIEQTLAGDEYKAYQDALTQEEAIRKEHAELADKPWMEMSENQRNRLEHLKKEIEGMKTESKSLQAKKALDTRMSDLMKDSRLSESYNERTRKGQAFQADLSKYDEKLKPFIQNAIDSKILNNTNRTHEFVETLAKISADKGVPFNFTNNAKLKESGFAVEGKTVNGFVNKDGITINIQSPTAWQSTVGHEITHVLEGTELYQELQDSIIQYAKDKGDYQGRIDSLTRLYQGIQGADINAELTADLVGEYLFNDSDFVNSLSTSHRNIFQKIYDEVKYLLKVVTAGSKEAKQLEKVKRAFEKAYQAGENASQSEELGDSKTKYSIREEAPPKETGVAYKVFFVKDGKLYPPMVANPDGADTPMGVWLNADVGVSAPPSKTGRQQVKAGGKGTQGGSGSLAFRPGWHLGDLPRASQFDRVNPETGNKELFPENFVWAEVEYAKDVDYQEEAMSYGYTDNGKFRHAYAGLPRLPENGYYRYRTNPKPDTVPWVITGAMKVNRLLSDAEVNKILEDNGVAPVHRQGGDVGLDKFGFAEDGLTQASSDPDTRYSLTEPFVDSEGNRHENAVLLDTDFFDGISPRNWGDKLKAEVNKRASTDPFILPIADENGNTTILQFASPDDRVKKAGGANHKVLDELSETSDNISKLAVIHIDEIVSVSEENSPYFTEGNEHGWLDKNGWLHRNADVINKKNGNIYNLTIDIAKAADGRTILYATKGKIRKVGNAEVNSLKIKGSGQNSNSGDIISQNSEKSRGGGKFSFSESDQETNQKLNQVGLQYDSKSETVSYSLSSLEEAFDYNKGEADYIAAREEYEDALAKSIAEEKGKPTEEERQKASRYVDSLFLIHDMIASDRDRLDYEAAVNKSAWVSNAEYGGSIDFSTLCAKRRLFTGTFDAIQNALPDTVLNENDFLRIRDMLLQKGLESPCSMCYVEGSRAKHGVYVERFLKDYLATNPEWRPQIADFTSSTRLEQTRIQHPEAYQAYITAMNKLAQRKPKEASVRTDYKGEILRDFADTSTVEEKNKNGGVRFNSFSDFEIIHTLDCMQVLTDMARVGLNGQAYTKVKEFAEAFGNTGLKINLSLVAKDVDANGKLIMDETNGMKYAEAMDIRNRFSENVGTVIVVFNDAQLKAALADSTIDYVLPFHRSQWKKSQYTLMGLPTETRDYTNIQNERYKNPKTGKAKKVPDGNIMPNEYWDFNLNGRENAQKYLDYINEHSYIPKFDFLLNKVDGKWVLPEGAVGDGYFKLLIDFKMYDNDGWGSPQRPVKPDFEMGYIQQMLADYTGGHQSFPVAHDVVREFVDGKKNGQFSLSEVGEAPTYGTRGTPAQDLYLESEEDIAPVAETAQEPAQVPETATNAPKPMEEDYAPLSEEEANALQDENLASLTDEDAPPEMEAPSYEPRPATAPDPFEKRDMKEVGNRKVKAYMFENPEVKPFFQDEARIMLGELRDTVKGERFYTETDTGIYWTGTNRLTSDDIAYLRDVYNYSYAEIEKGLNAIIEDNGAENNAVSKRIEFILNERLLDGYTGFLDGVKIPPNSDYINLINEQDNLAFNEEASRSLLESGDLYVPPVREDAQGQPPVAEPTETPIAEEVAPTPSLADQEANEGGFVPDKPIKTVKERIEAKVQSLQTELDNNQANREASRASYDEEIARLQADYNARKNKNTKAANDILRRIERTRRFRDSVDADYAKRISDTEAKLQKARDEQRSGESTSEQVAMRRELHTSIIERIKGRFAEMGFDFDEVLKRAKNLATFSTVDNTPQRVMEKSLGYQEGGVLADLTVNQVAQNETEGIKWLNRYTDRKNGLLAQISRQYNIKPGSDESAAAQMYAEGFYVGKNDDIIEYGDKELAKDFPDLQTQANIKGLAHDPRIRRIYDETLAMINESRARNAYPEIQRLDNYFLHFRAMDDTFSRLGLPFNPNDIKAKDLPTDLNGVTADLKPGQPYFASAMHRTGKRTSFDLLGGLESYLSSAKNQIYHIDDIQTLRALRNYVADNFGQAKGLENLDALSEEEQQEKIKEVYGAHLSTFAKFLNEEANVIAGKTALIDRGLEGIIGRRGIQTLDTINRQVGANMVGFNVSSSLTNFLSVAQAFAKTNKADFLKGFAQTVANKVASIQGRGDTFAQDSSVMIRRKGADRFYRKPVEKISDAGYVLMSAVDEISTEIIARAKYNEFIRNGMDSEQAHYKTDKWVSRLMGDRSLGQQPQLYNSKMLGLLTKFQLEVRNQLDSQFYDTIQEEKAKNEGIENAQMRNAKTAAKVASTFFQLAVAQHVFGKVFESVAGYNPAFDIIEAISKAFGWDDEEEDEDTVLDNIEQGFLSLLGDMPYYSILTGGRIPIESALPIEQFVTGKDKYGNEKSRLDTIKEAAPYYLLHGGYGQIKKTVQGLSMFDDDLPVAGSYTDSGNLRFPVEDTLGNRIQAGIFGQYASGNARDYFDNERKPLAEKQIEEYADLDIPIQDYWKIRDGMAKQDKLEGKLDYIDSLDLPIDKKNILANNAAGRKEPIDLSTYDQYASLEEFDFAQDNPEKYDFFTANGISYDDYKAADEDGRRAYTWAYENPEAFEVAKVVAGDVISYRQYTSELNDIRADKDENGKTINGSAKQKKIDYINGLDLDYGQKIILFKSEYEADNTYNQDILDYLNNRGDLSFDQIATILTRLGYKVTADGSVYWD